MSSKNSRKNYRFSDEVTAMLGEFSDLTGKSETEILETLVRTKLPAWAETEMQRRSTAVREALAKYKTK